LTCPDPTLGSGTLTGLFTPADGFASKTGAAMQWQYIALLSDELAACQRFRDNQFVQGEHALWVTLLGYHSLPGTATPDPLNMAALPNPPTPITLTVHQGLELPVGSGNAYTVAGHYSPRTGSKCKESGGSDATLDTGTVTFTTATDDLLEGSFSNLVFSAGTVSGAFTCPACVLCQTQPGRTCIPG
jgi:hypothetical protein